jgi:hypothetical protein
MERAIQLKKPLVALIQEMLDDDNSLYDSDVTEISKDDWIILTELCTLLRPFKDATVSSSGEAITSFSIQVPWYDSLLTGLESKKVVFYFLILEIL